MQEAEEARIKSEEQAKFRNASKSVKKRQKKERDWSEWDDLAKEERLAKKLK